MVSSVLKKGSVCQHQGYYYSVMNAFTLLDTEGVNNGETKHRVPKVIGETIIVVG